MAKMHNTPGVAGASAEMSSRKYSKKHQLSMDRRKFIMPQSGKFVKHNRPHKHGMAKQGMSK